MPGFVKMHTGRNCKRPPLSFAFWLQPNSLIWLGSIHDTSTTSSLALSIDSCLAGLPDKASSYRLFISLYGLMTSRYRRDDAVTTCTCRKGLAPSRLFSCRGSHLATRP